eukprot:Rhum_TRINITY_DN14249_c19_g1::Rhum_TRINITY_DN14249_c19_g1_i1::g.76968::m.76968
MFTHAHTHREKAPLRSPSLQRRNLGRQGSLLLLDKAHARSRIRDKRCLRSQVATGRHSSRSGRGSCGRRRHRECRLRGGHSGLRSGCRRRLRRGASRHLERERVRRGSRRHSRRRLRRRLRRVAEEEVHRVGRRRGRRRLHRGKRRSSSRHRRRHRGSRRAVSEQELKRGRRGGRSRCRRWHRRRRRCRRHRRGRRKGKGVRRSLRRGGGDGRGRDGGEGRLRSSRGGGGGGEPEEAEPGGGCSSGRRGKGFGGRRRDGCQTLEQVAVAAAAATTHRVHMPLRCVCHGGGRTREGGLSSPVQLARAETHRRTLAHEPRARVDDGFSRGALGCNGRRLVLDGAVQRQVALLRRQAERSEALLRLLLHAVLHDVYVAVHVLRVLREVLHHVLHPVLHEPLEQRQGVQPHAPQHLLPQLRVETRRQVVSQTLLRHLACVLHEARKLRPPEPVTLKQRGVHNLLCTVQRHGRVVHRHRRRRAAAAAAALLQELERGGRRRGVRVRRGGVDGHAGVLRELRLLDARRQVVDGRRAVQPEARLRRRAQLREVRGAGGGRAAGVGRRGVVDLLELLLELAGARRRAKALHGLRRDAAALEGCELVRLCLLDGAAAQARDRVRTDAVDGAALLVECVDGLAGGGLDLRVQGFAVHSVGGGLVVGVLFQFLRPLLEVLLEVAVAAVGDVLDHLQTLDDLMLALRLLEASVHQVVRQLHGHASVGKGHLSDVAVQVAHGRVAAVARGLLDHRLVHCCDAHSLSPPDPCGGPQPSACSRPRFSFFFLRYRNEVQIL